MSINILLVDDNPNNLVALEAILRDVGATLVKARSGPEALLRLLDHDFALILLDVAMPDLDGYETAELIRTRERSRHIPIIFLTAIHKSEPQVFRGYSVGAVDYLTKPFAPEVLKAKVQIFVELHKKTQELREAEQREQRRRLEEERHETLARKTAQLELIAGISHRLLVDRRSDALAREACLSLADQLGLDLFTLHMAEEDARVLHLDAQRGLSEMAAAELATVPYGRWAPGRAAEERRADLADQPTLVAAGDALWPAGLALRSHLCVPLFTEERLLGVLALASRSRPRLARDEVGVAEVVARQIAAALDRAALLCELRARDRQKDEFLAMLAHELRNPLTPTVAAIDLLRSRLGPSAGEELARPLGIIHRQVGNLARLVDDLLDVSRITTGKIELRPEVVELAAIVESAVQTSSPLLERNAHTFVPDLPSRPVRVAGDAVRPTQVVGNLLNNAAKYTARGGRIELQARTEGKDLLLVVRDNGVGIPPEMMSRIFDLFVQIDPSPERCMGGLGIGLALVKRLVGLHGGTIAARSAGPGRGSEFQVTLPIVVEEEREVAGADAASPAGPAVNRARVLVVDDNPDILEMLKEVLSCQGHEVHLAEDGPRALEVAKETAFDVILIDIGLPGLDGYGVAQRLRGEHVGQEGNGRHQGRPRLVALSGYGQAEDRQRALAAGFDAHLVKPVDASTLARVIAGQ